MKSLFNVFFVCLFASGAFAQVDDPFAAAASDDPFAAPTTTPAPASKPTTTAPSTSGNDDPFMAPSSTTSEAGNSTDKPAAGDDPFASTADSSDPFSSGGGDESPLGGGGSDAPADLLSGLADTLIQPLRPEFPWEKITIKERAPLEKSDVRQADVFWAKTVWREVDVREKMNHPFINPKAPFMTVLLDIIKRDTTVKLYAYDPFVDAEFQEETTWAKVNEGLGRTRTIEVPEMDAEGNITTKTQTITDKFNIGSVKKFRLKEVWYFDKVHSRMKVKIMGIAPIKQTTLAELGVTADVNVDLEGGSEDPLFWIYFPDVREKLAKYETQNPLNDALRMTWTDLLDSRFFSSYITKASNPLDRKVADYTTDQLRALYEGERIKEQIFNFEHDLWSY